MVQDNPLGFAVFRDQDNPGLDRILRCLELKPLPFDYDRTRRQWVGTSDAPDQFRAPGTDNAGDTKDLAGPHRKAYVAERSVSSRQPLHAQDFLAGWLLDLRKNA